MIYRAKRTTVLDGELVYGESNRFTRVSEDSELYRRHPDEFELDEAATAAERSEIRASDPRSGRTFTGEQLAYLAGRAEARAADERRVAELARDPRNREEGVGPHSARVQTPDNPRLGRSADRDAALYAMDRQGRLGALDARSGDRLADLIERDTSGADARYIAAVADEHYASAFAKLVADPTTGHLRLNPDEVEAVRRATQAEQERALTLTDLSAAGAFPAPFALDPTIVLTSDGSVNPIRELASVSTIASSEWRGVTSAGVVASFDAEATEVSDDTPTLAQPVIQPEKAQMFAKFSIEIGQDYASLQQELGRLFADARDQLEAEKFISGAGSAANEPEGLVAGLAAGSKVDTAVAGAYAIGDVYKLADELPARFSARATFLSSLTIAHITRRFAGPGSPEPPLYDDAMTRLIGKSWREVSQMASTVVTGEEILLYGDVSAAYKIVDRIGLQIELVPHIFGANQRPTGERGLYAYFRVGAAVVVDNAVRLLKVA